jgi:predicted nucleic acid-binding protein
LSRIHLSPDEIRDLVDMFLFLGDVMEPDVEHDPELRDLAGQPILALLRVSQAQYFITGDRDLLALNKKYPILTPADFWMRHG